MAAVGERRACSPTRVFFVPPSRHLLCSLCDDHFNEVVLPCAGRHTFCRACVLRWFERQRTCPECRVTIPANVALLPNRLALATVDELRVRCRFGLNEEGDEWVADEAGCPAQLTLDGAAAHEAACGFATTTTCPFAGWGVPTSRRTARPRCKRTWTESGPRGWQMLLLLLPVCLRWKPKFRSVWLLRLMLFRV